MRIFRASPGRGHSTAAGWLVWAALLALAHRWEASWLLDGALFVDAGKVAFDRRDLTFRELEVSYGLGFRVHSNSAFVARLDLAFSREGFIPLLRFEHAF